LSTPTAPTHLSTLSLHDALPISDPLAHLLGRSAGRVARLPGPRHRHHRRPRRRVPGNPPAITQAPQAPPSEGDPEVWRRRPVKRSEEHTSELQSRENLVCRLLLE